MGRIFDMLILFFKLEYGDLKCIICYVNTETVGVYAFWWICWYVVAMNKDMKLLSGRIAVVVGYSGS